MYWFRRQPFYIKVIVFLVALSMALWGIAYFFPSKGETATSASAAVRQLDVNKITMSDYVLGLQWEDKGKDALYHLKLSVDGSPYKTVDSWGWNNEGTFTLSTLSDTFPKAAKGFQGKVVVAYEVNGKAVAESAPLNFTGDPKNFHSIRWN